MSSRISYETIVEKEALDFLSEQHRIIIEGIKEESDFDRNDIDGLDEAWHENITDRAHSDTDARFIIDASDNVETDRGLWEGQDPDDALRTQAAYTFSNDVWTAAEKLYDELKETVDDRVSDVEIDDVPEPITVGAISTRKIVTSDAFSIESVFDEEETFLHARVTAEGHGEFIFSDEASLSGLESLPPEIRALAKVFVEEQGEPPYKELNEAFRAAVADAELEALVNKEIRLIEPGSDEERRELRRLLRAGRDTMRSGYPLGHAYIDSRCGYMYGTSEFDYVWMDRELSKSLPHLSGMGRPQLNAYWKATFGGPTPTTPEEMLDKLERMIREGADSNELYDLLPEIEAVRTPAPEAGPTP